MNAKRMLCAVAVLLFAASNSMAETVSFKFSGVVTEGGGLADVGTRVNGTFCYDMGTKASFRVKQQYAVYDTLQPCTISLTYGEHFVTTAGFNVSLFNNMGGNVEDEVIVDAYSATLDGVNWPYGGLGFALSSLPGNRKALKNVHLPDSFDIADFGRTLGYLQSDGSQTGIRMYFTIDSLETVSE